jgi:hypothetical protein
MYGSPIIELTSWCQIIPMVHACENAVSSMMKDELREEEYIQSFQEEIPLSFMFFLE